MNRLFAALLSFGLMLCLAGCTEPQAAADTDSLPPIFPDYVDVTVPPNIAPLNFRVEGADRLRADFAANQRRLTVTGDDEICIPEDDWSQLLTSGSDEIEVTVSVWNEAHPDGLRHAPFALRVAPDSIDPWIAYRLIPPGYRQWKRMGIYQRSMESFDEVTLLDNHDQETRCINCHSFCHYSPDKYLFHLRGPGGASVMVESGRPEKVELGALPPGFKGTYPFWHPEGRFVALSNNHTVQAFYTHSADKVEVYDLSSDLMIYDSRENRVLTDARFTDSLHWETFPAFSPDGRSLYFCSARPVLMPPEYDRLKYALLRVPFDAATGALGSPVDTLYSPAEHGGSVSFPRVSPDGRFLLFTEAACATFPIWHKEANLQMLDLSTGRFVDTRPLNSPDVESYHSWSSNGRWVIFSSRRIDGRYTRLFIAHCTPDGRFSKPFLLPQKSASDNALRLYSYNIPEFVRGRAELDHDALETLFPNP